MAQAVSLLLALMLSGCAAFAPTSSPESRAWATLCANAPMTAGMSISYAEQRAMTYLEVWHLSVEQLNQACAQRR